MYDCVCPKRQSQGGRSLQEQGKLDKAWELINETLDPANKRAESTLNWAEAWETRGAIIESIIKSKKEEYLKLVPDPIDEAYKSFMKAVELDPKYASTNAALKMNLISYLSSLTNAAVESYHAEKYEKATDYFEKVLNIEGTPVFKNEMKADTAIMFNTGLAAMSSKQYDKAIKYFNDCLALNYQPSSCYAQIIRSYQLIGDTVKYVEEMKEAASKFPNEQTIMVQLINYYISHGKSQEALDYLDKAIQIDPNNASFYQAKEYALISWDDRMKPSRPIKKQLN